MRLTTDSTTRRMRLAATAAALSLLTVACGSDDGATVRNLTAESETVEGSSSASASASGIAATGSTVGDSGYEYASNVDAHRLVVADICPMGDLLDAGDFAAVAELYENGENSVNSDGSIRSIGGFASRDDRQHGLDAFYGTPTPLDDFVRSALDGTGMFDGQADAVRAQGAEKGIQNQVMVAWVVHELNTALGKAESGDFDVQSGAVHNWDEGWAFYAGSEPGCAPFATAESRAQNFGTLTDEGTSVANANILQAMIDGRDALVAEDAAAAASAADEVVRNVVATYSQAAIRYASLIEGDLEAGDEAKAKEHQAEGLAFWRVIEAIVVPLGADGDTINTVLDLGNEPGANGFGDDIRTALEPAWSELGITAVDIGTLQG